MKLKVALDVGSCYIKVIEGCEGKKGQFVIRNIGLLPNPFPDVKEERMEREQDVFVKSLWEFLKESRIKSRSCVSGISGKGSIIHYFEIPPLPPEEIKPTVNLELMQVTPGGTKNLEYDYMLLPGKDKKKTVLFTGYQKDKCDFFTASLQRAGLRPLVIDHDSVAILNAFNFTNGDDRDTTFLLNIGHRDCNLAISEREGGFVLIRDIPFGYENIISVIAGKKKISEEAAEI